MNEADPKPEPAPMTLQATMQQGNANKGGNGTGGPEKQTTTSWSDRFSWPGRIALLLVVMLAPWAYGAYQYSPQWWMTVGILIALALWWFETAMNKRSSQVFSLLFFPLTAGLMIGLFQLVPLPDSIANLVMGQQPEIYAEFSDTLAEKPTISVDHDGTWRQIRLLMMAIGGLLLGCRYFRSKRDLYLFLTALTINGVLLGVIGILQNISGDGKIYWFKEIAAGGQPFGPFVNRNNAAGYLLICLSSAVGLLPIVMSQSTRKGPKNLISKEMPFWRQFHYYVLEFIADLTKTKLALLISIMIIASAVIATLSRGGVVALFFAAIATIVAYGMARQPKNSTFIFIPIILLVTALIGWLSFGDELAERFENIDLANVSETDLRVQHWMSTSPAIWENGLLGSGLGSYVGIHRLYRSDNENVIFEYAENQYFQALVEVGWPGLILFLIAWIIAFQSASLALSKGSSATTIGVGVMGTFLIFSQAMASVFDFGFYIPANMLALAVSFGFLSYHAQALGGRLKEQSWLRFKIPNYAVQVVILVMFTGVCMASVDLYSRSKIQDLLRPRAEDFTPETMDLEATDKKLQLLMPLLSQKPTRLGVNYAASLSIHRARLQLLDELKRDPMFEQQIEALPAEQQKTLTDNLWDLTNLQSLQENIFSLSKDSRYAEQNFRNRSPIRENLPIALQLLNHSRQTSPLQPVIHLRAAQVKAVLFQRGVGDVDIERALKLAPSNSRFRYVAAIYYLQSGNPEACAPHIKRFLELQPMKLKRVLNLLTGRTNRASEIVSPSVIAESMIPDNPKMLFVLATDYFPENTPERRQLLDRVVELIGQSEVRVHDNLVMLGDISLENRELEDAVEHYSSALLTNPADHQTRFKRAETYVELEMLDEALDDAEYLNNFHTKRQVYQNFLRSVQRLRTRKERAE